MTAQSRNLRDAAKCPNGSYWELCSEVDSSRPFPQKKASFKNLEQSNQEVGPNRFALESSMAH
jgi:hypothetical protein